MEVLFHGSGSYPPGRRIGPACWPHADLFLVTQGAVRLAVGRRAVDLEAGDGLLIPPGAAFHGDGLTEDTMIWVLHFQPTKPMARPKVYRAGTGDSFSRELLAEITFAARQGRKQAAYFTALAAALLALLEAPTGTRRLRHDQASRLWPDGDTTKSVREMAKQAGFSPSHYRAEFQKATGFSPRAYLRQARAEKARRLLQETRRPIKEIAQMVGYRDVVSFHRAFTQEQGCTPARYRRDSPTAA